MVYKDVWTGSFITESLVQHGEVLVMGSTTPHKMIYGTHGEKDVLRPQSISQDQSQYLESHGILVCSELQKY